VLRRYSDTELREQTGAKGDTGDTGATEQTGAKEIQVDTGCH